MRCCLGLLVWSMFAASAPAGTYEFDLTAYIRDSFVSEYPESVIDLAVQFARIDGASVRIGGEFTPGLMTPATIPPNTGPILPSDTVNLILRLGEIGTSFVEKPAYAIQDLRGLRGDVDVSLALRRTAPFDPTAPVYLPKGDADPDFDYLLDGRFGLDASSIHYVASLYGVLESPHFDVESVSLQIHGVIVPEPIGVAATWVLATLVVLARRRRGLR